MDFFDEHDITYKHQVGFQEGKSTEHAILEITTHINSIEKR